MNKSLYGHFGVLAAMFTVLTYASNVVFTLLGTRWQFFATHNAYFYGMEKLPILLISVCLFIVFVNVKVKCNKWINLIASATFGVYLIHVDEPIRHLLWETVFHNATYQNSVWLIPYSIAVVIIVYVFCTLLDLLRQVSLERVYMRFVNRNIEKVSLLFQRICTVLQRILFGD